MLPVLLTTTISCWRLGVACLCNCSLGALVPRNSFVHHCNPLSAVRSDSRSSVTSLSVTSLSDVPFEVANPKSSNSQRFDRDRAMTREHTSHSGNTEPKHRHNKTPHTILRGTFMATRAAKAHKRISKNARTLKRTPAACRSLMSDFGEASPLNGASAAALNASANHDLNQGERIGGKQSHRQSAV